MNNRSIKQYLRSKNISLFQKKVLLAVSEIPKGEVRTYKWVAKQIGHPSASRAVGQVLNKNPLPLVIPCHRVINSDRRLGGFVFGKKAKKRLLCNEGLTVKNAIVIIDKKRRQKFLNADNRRLHADGRRFICVNLR